MTKHLIRWLRWAWHVGALAIIVLALLSVTLRMIMPRLAHDPALIETWASRLVGAPVSIGSLESHWRNGQPILAVRDISVHLAHADGPEILRFAEAHASLDLWASLRAQRWRVGQLSLHGLTLKLVREIDGSGNTLWSTNFPGVFRASKMPNGNVLAVSMTTRKVAEIDRTGAIRWEKTCIGRPWNAHWR